MGNGIPGDARVLSGQEREEFEKRMIEGMRGPKQLLIRVLLEKAAGAPSVVVTNSELELAVGRRQRANCYVLAQLVDDGKIWKSFTGMKNRIIVLLEHPDAGRAIWLLGDASLRRSGMRLPAIVGSC